MEKDALAYNDAEQVDIEEQCSTSKSATLADALEVDVDGTDDNIQLQKQWLGSSSHPFSQGPCYRLGQKCRMLKT